MATGSRLLVGVFALLALDIGRAYGFSLFGDTPVISDAAVCMGMSYTAGGGNARVFVNTDAGVFKLMRTGP